LNNDVLRVLFEEYIDFMKLLDARIFQDCHISSLFILS
jgi:hypothetical protein